MSGPMRMNDLLFESVSGGTFQGGAAQGGGTQGGAASESEGGLSGDRIQTPGESVSEEGTAEDGSAPESLSESTPESFSESAPESAPESAAESAPETFSETGVPETNPENSKTSGGIPGMVVLGIVLAAAALAGNAASVFFLRRKKKKRKKREALQMEQTGELPNVNGYINHGQGNGYGNSYMNGYTDDSGAGHTQPLPDQGAGPRTLEDVPVRRGIYVGKLHNIGKRSSQQDSFGISQNGQGLSASGKGIFAIVADGMGGLSNGGEISALITMSMMQTFDQIPRPGDARQELLSMLNQANDEVNARLSGGGQGKSGSTVVAVILRDMQLYWISVGDSHIYLYREGALMQINRDHVYSVDLDEMAARGEISSREASGDPQRKALTSYIGMGKLAKIDRNIRPLKLCPGDRVMLMSDGVFGTLNDEEITAAMKLPLTESCEALDQMIRGKKLPAQDNYTALILECV